MQGKRTGKKRGIVKVGKKVCVIKEGVTWRVTGEASKGKVWNECQRENRG